MTGDTERTSKNPFRPFWVNGATRRDFIYTMIWDGAVIAAAYFVKAGLLYVRGFVPGAELAATTLRFMEWVSDHFFVAMAALFALFDLLKRVVAEAKEVIKAARTN